MSMRPAFALFALLAAPPVALQASHPSMDLVLEWKPTRTATELGMTSFNLLPFQGKTIVLAPFSDRRADPLLIGENREKASRVVRVTTHDEVPAWVAGQTRQFLARLGLPLAEGGSSRVLTGEVLSFFVAEGGEYLGDVRLQVQIQKDGKTLWSGLAIGAAKHFGRSLKADNYQETLSDSLLEALVSLGRNPEFLSALAQ